jgi:hypothetical protein
VERLGRLAALSAGLCGIADSLRDLVSGRLRKSWFIAAMPAMRHQVSLRYDPAMSEPAKQSDDVRERRIANVVLLVFFVLVIGIGLWLVNALIETRRIDECLAQGRRNCGPSIEVPPR